MERLTTNRQKLLYPTCTLPSKGGIAVPCSNPLMTLFDFETDMWLIGRQNMGLSTTEGSDGKPSYGNGSMQRWKSPRHLTERSALLQQWKSPRHWRHWRRGHHWCNNVNLHVTEHIDGEVPIAAFLYFHRWFTGLLRFISLGLKHWIEAEQCHC